MRPLFDVTVARLQRTGATSQRAVITRSNLRTRREDRNTASRLILRRVDNRRYWVTVSEAYDINICSQPGLQLLARSSCWRSIRQYSEGSHLTRLIHCLCSCDFAVVSRRTLMRSINRVNPMPFVSRRGHPRRSRCSLSPGSSSATVRHKLVTCLRASAVLERASAALSRDGVFRYFVDRRRRHALSRQLTQMRLLSLSTAQLRTCESCAADAVGSSEHRQRFSASVSIARASRRQRRAPPVGATVVHCLRRSLPRLERCFVAISVDIHQLPPGLV
jgi:hypothetical protein